jgi:hypothetical protein
MRIKTVTSSVTEEHVALRHILCRGPFERRKIFSGNTYDVYCHCRCLFIVIPYNRINLNHDRINLNLVGAPNFQGPLVLELTLTTVRYATDGYMPESWIRFYCDTQWNSGHVSSRRYRVFRLQVRHQ